MLVIAWVASGFGDAGVAIFSVGLFLVVFGYPTLSEALVNGQTIGKAALGLAVVRTDGTPVRFFGAVIRNVVRVIDALPGVYTVGFISVLATKRAQRLGDLAAATVVIHRRNRAQRGAPAATWEVPVGPPPEWVQSWDLSMVTAEEIAAVRAFLGRRDQLAPVHRNQLAITLADQLLPKVAGVPTERGPEAFLELVVAAKSNR